MRVYRKKNVNARKTAALLAVFFSALTVFAGSAPGQSLEYLDQEIARVVGRISDAVVTVEARIQESRAPRFPGPVQKLREPVNAVVGSGLLIDSLGHLLTVLSLVDGRDNFRVHYRDQNLEARLVGVDRGHNLAVLQIDEPIGFYLVSSLFPPFAGRLVLAYGRAAGGTGYPSLGIIAGRQRDGTYLVSGSAVPGTLGGGVFDLTGQLIGVISSGSIPVSESYGGFRDGILMIPAATAYTVADRIICCGNREAGYLGVTTTAIELVSAAEKVLGEAVVVSEVAPDSPAEKAGLKVGDIITRFAFRDVIDDRQLQRLISSAGPDSTVMIDIIRGGKNVTIRVPLGRHAHYGAAVRRVPSPGEINARLILELQRRINIMRVEMEQLQYELERLLSQGETSR